MLGAQKPIKVAFFHPAKSSKRQEGLQRETYTEEQVVLMVQMTSRKVKNAYLISTRSF